MKKVFLFATTILSLKLVALTSMPADTNKMDASGKKIGLWKEQLNQSDYYGNYGYNGKEGLWIGYYANGIISNIDEYKSGKKMVIVLPLIKNGFYNQKDFYIDDQLNGLSISYFSGAIIHTEIEYKMGSLNGIKRIHYNDGKMQEEGNYKNNLRDGITKWYTTEGKLSIEYSYKNGLLDGRQKTYFSNGNIDSEVSSVNNLQEGDYHEYFENGKIKLSGKFLHDKKEGAWKEFNEEGKIVKTENYKNGALNK